MDIRTRFSHQSANRPEKRSFYCAGTQVDADQIFVMHG
jgi:hypothetical protein